MTEQIIEKREWFCAHCMEVTETEGRMSRPPSECPHCRVGFCTSCGTRQKHGAKLCHGCGNVMPTVEARMCSTSSMGGVYVQEQWAWNGLPEGREHVFTVSTGWKTHEAMRNGEPGCRWITKSTRDGNREDVRDLTDEEWGRMYPKTIQESGNAQ